MKEEENVNIVWKMELDQDLLNIKLSILKTFKNLQYTSKNVLRISLFALFPI